MVDDKDDKKEGQGEGDGARREPGPVGAGDEQEDERPRITLDRYMSGRRRTSSWSIAHLLALLFMLGALVMLLMYKDRCGQMASGIIFMGTPDRGPPVKIQMEPTEKPASRPARP